MTGRQAILQYLAGRNTSGSPGVWRTGKSRYHRCECYVPDRRVDSGIAPVAQQHISAPGG